MENPMLQVPLEISFHNIPSSEPAEREIRARVAELERLYERLISCRVRIDQRAKDLTGAIPPVVRIELGIAERRLVELKEERVDRKKAAAAHDAQSQSLGQIAELHPERDFGFLMTKEGGLLYFHRNAVGSGDFDDLKRGDEVHYNEDVGDTGPIATKVRVKGKE